MVISVFKFLFDCLFIDLSKLYIVFIIDDLIIWDYKDGLVKVGAARLIELIKSKIKPSANVSLYEKHCLVLVTNGKSSQKEILAFANQIQSLVKVHFNVWLEIEPTIIN